MEDDTEPFQDGFLRAFFIKSLLEGAILVPALDAFAIKLKQIAPNMKKKKGALPAEVQEFEKKMWNGLKQGLKAVMQSIEKTS